MKEAKLEVSGVKVTVCIPESETRHQRLEQALQDFYKRMVKNNEKNGIEEKR